MRGGTLLHKVHLAPAARYSEDIDLVVVGTRPPDHIRRAIRRVWTDVLGTPKASVWDTLKLAIRNTVKPSRVLRMRTRPSGVSSRKLYQHGGFSLMEAVVPWIELEPR
jgi:Nucleotidyl transferase AbiEii toxin, Type IV TA system